MEREQIEKSDILAGARVELLEKIYNEESLPFELLDLVDLDIYGKPANFFQKMSHGVKTSFLDPEITLTNQQIECLSILNEQNLFLSAPTSFGKTFVALEYIKRKQRNLRNIVFIVPTLSLMNEIRRKCIKYFCDYSIIMSEGQLKTAPRNSPKIFILVPERYLTEAISNYFKSNTLDLLVFDEIYKLGYDPDHRNGDDRVIIMNYVFKSLINKAKKFILLGPFIKSVNLDKKNYNFKEYITNLNLVYNMRHKVDENFDCFGTPEDKRFIYFSSPNSIFKFIGNYDSCKLNNIEYDKNIVRWLENEIDPDYLYCDYIKKGIGIHHGHTPLFLRVYFERHYAKNKIHTMLCTSTLIEGINTPTNSVYIYDVPNSKLQLNNIVGRVGRLNVKKPKAGTIYYASREVEDLFNSEEWLDINLISENESLLIPSKPLDELVYLEKKADDMDILDRFEQKLKEYGFTVEFIKQRNIDCSYLESFIDFIKEDCSSLNSEYQALLGLIRLTRDGSAILNLLKTKNYNFFEAYEDAMQKDEGCNGYLDNYLPLLIVLKSGDYVKKSINWFKDEYQSFKGYNSRDLNRFIENVFRIEKFYKNDLSKFVPIIELFAENKMLSDKCKYIVNVSKYLSLKTNLRSPNERILEDMGYPIQDILAIRKLYIDETMPENLDLLLKSLKDKDCKLSPFGQEILDEYFEMIDNAEAV